MFPEINGIDWQDVVECAVADAYGICWDECHKIYICEDEIAYNSMRDDYGYTMQRLTDDVDPAGLLFQWFENSCGLQFIHSIDKNDEILNIVPQWYKEEGGQV
jgi:hypothetical protein